MTAARTRLVAALRNALGEVLKPWLLKEKDALGSHRSPATQQDQPQLYKAVAFLLPEIPRLQSTDLSKDRKELIH